MRNTYKMEDRKINQQAEMKTPSQIQPSSFDCLLNKYMYFSYPT